MDAGKIREVKSGGGEGRLLKNGNWDASRLVSERGKRDACATITGNVSG